MTKLVVDPAALEMTDRKGKVHKCKNAEDLWAAAFIYTFGEFTDAVGVLDEEGCMAQVRNVLTWVDKNTETVQ